MRKINKCVNDQYYKDQQVLMINSDTVDKKLNDD